MGLTGSRGRSWRRQQRTGTGPTVTSPAPTCFFRTSVSRNIDTKFQLQSANTIELNNRKADTRLAAASGAKRIYNRRQSLFAYSELESA